MEADDRVGLVEEYLNTPLPENWNSMDLYEWRDYLSDRNDPPRTKSVLERQTVSNVEIWSGNFGRNPADMKSSDSYVIAALMTQLDGWERAKKFLIMPIYGRQRAYVRVSLPKAA